MSAAPCSTVLRVNIWKKIPPPYEACHLSDDSPSRYTRPTSVRPNTPQRPGAISRPLSSHSRASRLPYSEESPPKRFLRYPRRFRLPPMNDASNQGYSPDTCRPPTRAASIARFPTR